MSSSPSAGIINEKDCYPFPGFTSGDYPVHISTPLYLSGSLAYIAVVVLGGTLHVATWNFTTNTLTDLGTIASDAYVGAPMACWNADKTKIYIVILTANGSGTARVFEYVVATNTATELGTTASFLASPSDIQFDAVTGTIFVAIVQGAKLHTLDPSDLAVADLTETLLGNPYKIGVTAEYIYGFAEQSGEITEGPVCRLHRGKGFFQEHLAGVSQFSAGGRDYATQAIPCYGDLNISGSALDVNSGGEVVFGSMDNAGAKGLYFVDSNRQVVRFEAVGNDYRGLRFIAGDRFLSKFGYYTLRAHAISR